MKKLTAAARYFLSSLFTVTVLAAFACSVLRSEWRLPLIRLLSRSFTTFAESLGTNRLGWLVSNVYSPVFLIIAIVILVGIMRGLPAMRKYWVGTAVVALMAVGSVTVLFFGFIYFRTVVRTVYEDHQFLVSRSSQLARDKAELAKENRAWETKKLNFQRAGSNSSAQESPTKLRKELRSLAGNILDFQTDKLANIPPAILIAVPGGQETMRKNMENSIRYNQEAVLELLKRFGGPIDACIRRVRPYQLDTTRLQSHVADLNSIQMITLIANDLSGLADQLDDGNLLSSSSGAQKTHCPSYYFRCP